jgi:hypothetical protein
MKVQRDKLQQYQKRIKIVTDRETEVARECLRLGHKDKALLALRRKKYQESLLTKTDQQLAQLQALTSDVEFALVQKDVVFGLQQGTAVLKEIHKEMGGLEKVELIMSETEEAQAYQNVGRTSERAHMEYMRLTDVPRKSTRCSVVRCQMRTRMRWKTSWQRWSGKRVVYPPCPMRPHEFKSLCLKCLRAIHREQERRRGHNRDAREKRLQPRRRSSATRLAFGVLKQAQIYRYPPTIHSIHPDQNTVCRTSYLLSKTHVGIMPTPVDIDLQFAGAHITNIQNTQKRSADNVRLSYLAMTRRPFQGQRTLRINVVIAKMTS